CGSLGGGGASYGSYRTYGPIGPMRPTPSSLPLLHEDEDPLLVRHDHVRELVAVDVLDGELGADPGVDVDDHGREPDKCAVRLLVLALDRDLVRLEPIKHGRPVGAGLGAAVRPPALAGDQVLHPVAVDIDAVHGMRLRQQLAELRNLDEVR